MEKKQQKNSSYMFRLVIGAYLIYLAYGLIKEMAEGSAPLGIMPILCSVLFGAAGILLVVLSGKKLHESRNSEEG